MKRLLPALIVALAAACHKSPAPPAPGGAHTVAVTADDKGFSPASVAVKKGEQLVLRFTRTTDNTCATKVVFPALHLEKDLPLDKPVDVVVPTTEARTLTFQCGMAMFQGAVVVE